jgi:hypothetical protein
MPKKAKPLKPIPSALTVTSAKEIPLQTAPKTPRRTVAAAKPLSKPVNPPIQKNAKTGKPSKPASGARKTAPRESEVVSVATGPRPVTFVLAHAHAGRVLLSGDFNEWSTDATPMTPQGDGRWQVAVALPPGRHQYKFIVDGQWMPDPNGAERVADGFGDGNSVIEVRG